MIFKLKSAFLGLIFIAGLFISISWSLEIAIPPLADAVKISEKNVNIGPLKAFNEIYETSLNQNKVLALYRKQLLADGWKEQRIGVFMKDRYMVLLTFFKPIKKATKLRFSVLLSKVPTEKEANSTRKANPDKLNFMPIYPGCEQTFLWDTNTGYMASYETKASVKEVVFFYKSGMLNYGWNLISETPIMTKAIDCPECGKFVQGAAKGAKLNVSGVMTKATLMFKKGDKETCSIAASNTTMNTGEFSSGPGTTKIAASYYVYEGIH